MGEQEVGAPRPLRRREAKAVTRRRLLDAALEILDKEGLAAVTTTRVTKVAGIGQSSFYVHFADVDDLLQNLISDLALERRRRTRNARRTARRDPGDAERLRETYRVPLQDVLAHPALLRLLLQTRHEPNSPLGDWSRDNAEAARAALVEDLSAAGLPTGTPSERRRAEMIADGLRALVEGFAVGHLDGRFPDIEEIVDVLVLFSQGYFPLMRPAPGPVGSTRGNS